MRDLVNHRTLHSGLHTDSVGMAVLRNVRTSKRRIICLMFAVTKSVKSFPVGEAPTCKFDDQQKRNIQTGHKLHLYCTAGGSEPLTYKWLHDGVELPAYSGPDLVIEHVKPDAAGEYECRVDNDFGKDSTSIKIKVGKSILHFSS